MSLMLAALIAQAAPLDADNYLAGKRCAVASTLGSEGEPQLRVVARLLYFVMQAAKARPTDKALFARVEEINSELDSDEGDAALLPECLRRFPLAHATREVTLPADPFRRDMLCFGTYSVLLGAAQEIEKAGGGAVERERIEQRLTPFLERLTDEMLEREGVSAEAELYGAMGREMLVSLNQGNLEMVRNACDRAYPAKG